MWCLQNGSPEFKKELAQMMGNGLDDDEEEEGTNKANAHFPKYAFAKSLTYKYITKSSFHFPKLTLTRI